MRIHNLWKNVSALLVAGCICCTMPLCNNDEAPATIAGTALSSLANKRNEAGEATLK